VVMLVWRRFRRAASFFALLPAAAVGGAVFGFWLALQHYGPIGSDQDQANAVYYGAIPSSAVGAGLALRTLTWRSGRLWPVRSAVFGSVTALITLTCLTVWRTASDTSSTGTRAGWDPIAFPPGDGLADARHACVRFCLRVRLERPVLPTNCAVTAETWATASFRTAIQTSDSEGVRRPRGFLKAGGPHAPQHLLGRGKSLHGGGQVLVRSFHS